MSKKKRDNNNLSLHSKKQKQQLKSVFFSNSKDQQQFQSIYTNVAHSSLIISYNIHQDLIQLISEYSTGKYMKCLTCHADNNVLEIDFEHEIIKHCIQCNKKMYPHHCDNVNRVQKCFGFTCDSCGDYGCIMLRLICNNCSGDYCWRCFTCNGTDECEQCYHSGPPFCFLIPK